MKVTRPVLRYFGGKFRLRNWIVDHLPPHDFYCEPFGGAASVLMAKEPAKEGEAYNDLNANIVNIFKVLRDPKKKEALKLLLEYTPYSQEEFKAAECFEQSDNDVERARKTIVRSFMGIECSGTGKAGSGFRMKNVNLDSGNYRNVAKDWKSYRDCLDAFTERLQLGNVILWNEDAFKIIDQYESPRTLFYIDPPYTLDTRKARYAVEFEQEQQERLIERLLRLDAMVVLSGYDNTLYECLGWQCERVKTTSLGLTPREECLWLNPAAIEAQAARQEELQFHG